ncbi:MAG: hypothetical protein IJD54_02010 [Clostridia bacterium]|nr:hypothetical protein [Clostridia bacterium]
MRNYSLRFSLLPTVDFNERMEKLLDFCDNALIDDVMFFISPEEVNVGHITIEQVKPYVETILRAKSYLKEKGITISLNPWCTMSHYDGGRKLFDGQNFRTMVGADGVVAERVACPLCKNWRDYYAELIGYLSKLLSPRIMWFEDDMRYSNHDPVWHGCFCEEHMKLYNAKLNSNYDRETFVKLIFTDQNVKKAYLDVLGESIKETIEYIVSRCPEQEIFGIMTGGAGQNEGRKYKDIYSAMSENGVRGKPYNRLCLYSYRQRGLQSYAWAINEMSTLARAFAGNNANCVSEIENFPHSMYTKSANYLKYQMLSTAHLGLVGDTLSIFEFNGNGAVNYDKYAAVLKQIKPYLSRITKLDLKPSDMVGVRVLISEDSSYTIKSKNGRFSDLLPYDGWIYAYLEQLGIACAYSFNVWMKNKIVAVSGQVLRNFDAEAIEHLFKHNYVIMTADNIDALKDKGLLSLVGIADYEICKELSGKHSMEEINGDDEILGIKKMRATAQFFCGDYYNINYTNADRKVFTKMLNYDQTVVGDGITEVNNVLIIPYANTRSDQQVPISLLCPLREYVIKTALMNNPVTTAELYLVSQENVCPYVFDKGEKVYMVLMNYIDDTYKRIEFIAPYLFDNLKYFNADNETVRQAAFESDSEGNYKFNHPLKAQESLVVVCKKEL